MRTRQVVVAWPMALLATQEYSPSSEDQTSLKTSLKVPSGEDSQLTRPSSVFTSRPFLNQRAVGAGVPVG